MDLVHLSEKLKLRDLREDKILLFHVFTDDPDEEHQQRRDDHTPIHA